FYCIKTSAKYKLTSTSSAILLCGERSQLNVFSTWIYQDEEIIPANIRHAIKEKLSTRGAP
ncbi:TPA: hypothetical protein ACHXAU_004862, partial [Escherichia coli]